ncbi:MAG TPA: SusC/RagA family TonB-linked outer membrane protein [Leeuwenhoekiella sp.]|uniref:SusC/RagA family TonB-linked outer membrane protein n=1 Tax=Leeuwenhoekiella sp. UBA4164 TaxID=1946746 RepID=UPI000C3D67F2|nr:TonB-dependent receptor [Leeuwenhoekiella sp. UBA4164]MBH14408.1 SusC/RagA family TonB-linked outer membrane protein [Leeuwenhoekiella sp.]HCQ78185.1 SusC/RagA family TonB-linked outer membrane protein [Leeuwenhoekiella sp.]|tara:strand:+ start:2830 stop:5895 length:3066 start_codon:yes stop_codon:yes gene_type:complete
MKSKITWCLALGLLFLTQLTFAQQKTVTGTVTDGSNVPLPGVNVVVKGTTTGTQTDFDGNYSISAAQGDVLTFSYVGFTPKDVAVGASSTYNVTLEEGEALEEVIVLGYTTKSTDEVTGSSVQVEAADIESTPFVSADQALQGKVAGLQISQASGTPGSIQDIRIRGVSSFASSNEPLYVIDGVPVNNSNAGGNANASSLNPLASISAQDIKSITVLKDASATAQYGARGSNGVIVVTTKNGSEGKTTFTFTSTVGIQNDAFNKRDVLTGAQRQLLTGEALVNAYGANGSVRDLGVTPGNAINDGIAIGALPAAYADYNGENYDWSGLIKNEDALMQNYNFSASGGDELSTFYASVGYNKTEATVIGGEFERVNGLVRVTRKLRDNIDFSTSVNVSNTKQNPILEQGSFFSNPFITRYLMNPLNNPFNADGTPTTDLTFGSLHNTLYVLDNNITRNMLTRAISNSKLDWEWFENFTFSNTLSLDYQLAEYRNYQNRYEGDSAPVNGASEAADSKLYNYVYQGSFNYNFKLGDVHNFDVTALFEYQKNQNSYLYGYGENFPADGLTNIASASANFDATSSFTDWYNVSYLGLFNYNYDGKYIVDATIRREGSSFFPAGKRFGTFGSVGLAWNVYKEDFMRGSIFNELRLRGSYGVTGNNGVGSNTYQALLSYGADYSNNGGATPSQFGNADLSWENGNVFDAGVVFGVFDNRLSGSFTYFNRETTDLLQQVPLSLTTGFGAQNRNIGAMTNKGIEAMLSVDIIRNQDFNWSVSGNIATVRNEVTELAVGADGNDLDPLAGSVYKSTVVGEPVASWYMRTWAGVDTETGAPTWYLNGQDGEVTSNYNEAERTFQGSALPTYSGGFGTRVSWKGFFAEANAYFAGGHKIYEQFAQFYLRTNSFTLGSYNGAAELLERWQQPGDVTDIPKLDYAQNDNFHATSTRHLYDGDYIRLKNVALGYSLPSKFLKQFGLYDLTLTLRGTNVATWVKDDGLTLDPEVRANGYTTLTTPPVETYTFGVNVKF